MEKVFLHHCRTYDTAVIKTLLYSSLQELNVSMKNIKVLLKPNLLSPKKPEQAVTTHPVVVEALAELLKDLGCTIFVGDSPGYGTTNMVLHASGITAVMRRLGLHAVSFSSEIIKKSTGISPYREFVFGDDPDNYDMVINLPKLKTHTMMGMTMGVKNTFGFIHALDKAKWHARAGQDRYIFASILIDIHRIANPSLTILDGIVGMDQDGPSSGRPRNLGILGVCRNAFALDAAVEGFLRLPHPTLITDLASQHGIVPAFEVFDSGLPRIDDFMLPLSVMDTDWNLPSFAKRVLKSAFFRKPKVTKKLCKSCGICVKACPNQALLLAETGPRFEYSRCIRCYCCQEMCPEGAIKV